MALLTAGLTVPLLFIGGLVTSKGAGLAVPDWPTTFGYNMFLYPWSKMVGDIFYEHSHRLVASAVGLLTIALFLSLWVCESKRWLRWLGAAALGLVVIQGIMGGLRVVLLEHTFAIIHACLAQAFFALAVTLALVTSKEWQETNKRPLSDAGRIQRLGALTTAMIYLQVVFGAVLRHTGARLDAHLLLAGLVAIHVFLLGARVLGLPSDPAQLRRPTVLLVTLLVLQLATGLGSFWVKIAALEHAWPDGVVVLLTTTHLATGALMLVASLVVTLRSFRFLAPVDPFEHKVLQPKRLSV